MSKELIERLRADAESTDDIGLCADAADRIEELERERDTAWAQAHRLALELECLIMDTKDNAVVSKWWDSAFEAIEEYQSLKPGADDWLAMMCSCEACHVANEALAATEPKS